MNHIFLSLLIPFVWGCASELSQHRPLPKGEVQSHPYLPCNNDSQKQSLRSKELKEIVEADQADRQIPGSQINWNIVSAKDEVRAKRVAEIFAEGCFSKADDYAAAALVFQHGIVPDHYYQAYLWSKRALEMGDETQRQMIANSVDRYLLSLGYRQLFGAQTFRSGPNQCHCLDPTELKFSEKSRLNICGISLGQRIQALQESNRKDPVCREVIYCDKKLLAPPRGIIPGIW